MCSADIFLGLMALLFPPLPVWVKCGICSADSLINILLCMLGYLPGLIHAWYIIAKYPEPPYEYEAVNQDSEHGRVTYVFVNDGRPRPSNRPHSQQPKPVPAPSSAPAPNYGTTNAPAQASSSSAPRDNNGGEGSSEAAPPPAYTEVAGDHKVQTQN